MKKFDVYQLISVVFIGNVVVCYGILLYQWEIYLSGGFLSILFGLILGILIGLIYSILCKKLLFPDNDTRFLNKSSNNLIRFLINNIILVISISIFYYILYYQFNEYYVYARWFFQDEMNTYLFQLSLIEGLILSIGIFIISQDFSKIKTKKARIDEIKQNKKGIKFSKEIIAKYIFSSFMIYIIVTNPYIVTSVNVQQDITKRYDWNDGPWLSFYDNPDKSIVISWLTKQNSNSDILFGTDPNNLELLHDYDINGPNYKGNLHHIFLNNLNPKTKYYYKIPNVRFQEFEKEKIFSFNTSSDSNDDYSFIVVGDMQSWSLSEGTAQDLVAKGIKNAKPDFVCATGDLGDFGRNLNDWHYLMSFLPEYASETAFQSTIGNHDWYGDNGTNFRNVFPYTYNDSDAAFYSFNYQNSHFIMLDSVSENETAKDNQKNWLIQDLDYANNTLKQDWIFIFLHYSPITSGGGGGYTNILQWIAPIAAEYKVDCVFYGHEHFYEHWEYEYGYKNVVFDESDQAILTGEPVHYFLTGGGGATLNPGWDILDHEPNTKKFYFHNLTTHNSETIETISNPWNSSRYVENETNSIYGYSQKGPLYYYSPELEDYWPIASDIFGYQYGEQTTHYIEAEMTNNGKTCKISVRYPNGELLMGPNNLYPQEWVINK